MHFSTKLSSERKTFLNPFSEMSNGLRRLEVCQIFRQRERRTTLNNNSSKVKNQISDKYSRRRVGLTVVGDCVRHCGATWIQG